MSTGIWISVDERIPDIKDGSVLIIDKYGDYGIGFAFCFRNIGGQDSGTTVISAFGETIEDRNITHWMPLPPPPGETP